MKLGYLATVAVAVLIFAATSVVTFIINRRRFDRRNAFGCETFPNYGVSLATRVTERAIYAVASLIKWTAVGIGLSALFMLLRL